MWIGGNDMPMLSRSGRGRWVAAALSGMFCVSVVGCGADKVEGRPEGKHFVHRELGTLHLTCQTLIDPAQSHSLLVYTANPGTESHEKLQLLAVVGAQTLT